MNSWSLRIKANDIDPKNLEVFSILSMQHYLIVAVENDVRKAVKTFCIFKKDGLAKADIKVEIYSKIYVYLCGHQWPQNKFLKHIAGLIVSYQLFTIIYC